MKFINFANHFKSAIIQLLVLRVFHLFQVNELCLEKLNAHLIFLKVHFITFQFTHFFNLKQSLVSLLCFSHSTILTLSPLRFSHNSLFLN